MKLNNLNIYMRGLAVYLCYRFRDPFCVWSHLSKREEKYWLDAAYELIKHLKKQKPEKDKK